jgi:hypothetical protein
MQPMPRRARISDFPSGNQPCSCYCPLHVPSPLLPAPYRQIRPPLLILPNMSHLSLECLR